MHGVLASGPSRLTVPGAVTSWIADPAMIVLVVVLGVAYLAGVRRVRRAGGDWGTGRVVAFVPLGLGFLVLATMWWPGAYQNYLFYARATQTVLLVLVVPLFLAMGKPITLALLALPASVAGRVEAAVRGRVLRVLTFPAITTFALVAVPMTMYFTSWYTAAFSHVAVRELTFLALMAPGFVFFWTLLRVDPVPKAYSYAISMWITGAEVVGDAIFGLAIIADTNLIAARHYAGLGQPWTSGLHTSQVIGGGIIWILGDLVGLPFLAAQLIQLMREDAAEAAAIDAELDAKEAAHLAAAASTDVPTGAAEPDAQAADPSAQAADPLWWEEDSRFTGRFDSA